MSKRVVGVALGLLISCGGGPESPPAPVAVNFLYVSRFPDGCPNPDAGFCFHHIAPGGYVVLVPLWGPARVSMTSAGDKRWSATLTNVPVGAPLSLQVSDIQGCCFDGVLVVHDVYGNGVLLTRVVQADAGPALEFSVEADGRVKP